MSLHFQWHEDKLLRNRLEARLQSEFAQHPRTNATTCDCILTTCVIGFSAEAIRWEWIWEKVSELPG